ncbi:hypothetical protein ACTFIY_001848 [Dictyostelium cf. discoideum]
MGIKTRRTTTNKPIEANVGNSKGFDFSIPVLPVANDTNYQQDDDVIEEEFQTKKTKRLRMLEEREKEKADKEAKKAGIEQYEKQFYVNLIENRQDKCNQKFLSSRHDQSSHIPLLVALIPGHCMKTLRDIQHTYLNEFGECKGFEFCNYKNGHQEEIKKKKNEEKEKKINEKRLILEKEMEDKNNKRDEMELERKERNRLKEERVRKSSELGEKLRFMTDDTRKQFHSLSSNQTYHNEKSYNNIKQLELDALKNQDETSKMLMCMRVFCSSFSNSPQMTPSLQPTIQFNNNFTPSPNSACSYQNLNSNADVDKTLLKLKQSFIIFDCSIQTI